MDGVPDLSEALSFLVLLSLVCLPIVAGALVFAMGRMTATMKSLIDATERLRRAMENGS